MVVTLKIKTDLISQVTSPVVMVPQNDGGGRELEMELYAGTEPWPVPEGATVRLYYAKPDGTGGSYDTLEDGSIAWRVDGNILTLKLVPQMFTAAGNVAAKVEFLQGEQILHTFGFWLWVRQDCTDGAMTEEEYFNWSAWTYRELERMMTEAIGSGTFIGPQGEKGDTGETGAPGAPGVSVIGATVTLVE